MLTRCACDRLHTITNWCQNWSEAGDLLISDAEGDMIHVMKAKLLLWVFLSGSLLLGFAAEGTSTGPKLYDTKANGTEEIKAALERAQKENKNVLLKFGANWCGWCHRLSAVFHDNKDVA